MGIFDKAKDVLADNADKVSQGIDKAGDLIDAKTGGQHAEHVDQAQAEAKRRLEELRTEEHGSAGPSDTPATATPPASNPPSTPQG